MDHFHYKNGLLHAEDVPVPDIAAAVGTPFYVYARATLERHFDVFQDGFQEADVLVAFAVKALSNIAVLNLLARKGAGADIVSGGEMVRALRAGIPAQKIVFSGVGKTREELAAAMEAGIGQFNVESEAELHQLNEIARQKNLRAAIALRINPNVDAGTHDKISTGRADDKFGIPRAQAMRLFRLAHELEGIDVQGLAMHIGSQITSLAPFEAAAAFAVEFVGELRGEGMDIRTLDLGGGLGIPYTEGGPLPPLPKDYALSLRAITDPLGVKLIFEPGRMIAGNAGLFVTRILLTKTQTTRRFAIIDGAMNDLIRPALYGAQHAVMPVRQLDGEPALYDLAGPVCESTDIFAKDVKLIKPEPGQLLALRSAGAYGAVQASQYNTRPLVPEVLVSGADFHIIRRRPTYDEMLSLEAIPEWND